MKTNLVNVRKHPRKVSAATNQAVNQFLADMVRAKRLPLKTAQKLKTGAGPLNLFDYRNVKGGSVESMKSRNGVAYVDPEQYAEDLRDMAAEASNMPYGMREANRLRAIADDVLKQVKTKVTPIKSHTNTTGIRTKIILDAQKEVGY